MKLAAQDMQGFMQQALRVAQEGASRGEVPVGAVVVHQGSVVAEAHNEVESSNDSSAHAEVLAMRRAAQVLGDWRLHETQLFVTLEPCTMCVGAVKLARVPLVVFAATDERLGACSSLFDLMQDTRLGPEVRVVSGVCADESVALLQSFFQSKRKKRDN
ncbi:MAG: nucleoside deaminase [Bdellovibrionales bacterium]|nr:nucleoside deaminase [Bdellovibrionales bacterium]